MDDLKEIRGRNGKLQNTKQVPLTIIENYEGRLPEMILQIWLTEGLGTWLNGLFRFCLPDDFDGLLAQVFHGDQDFSDSDCHVFAYTVFGVIFVWSERHGLIKIDLLRNQLVCNRLTKINIKSRPETAITVLLYMLSENESLDELDDEGNKLFNLAVKNYGFPKSGEAFGFFPALAIGGSTKIDNIKIVPALAHFFLIAQLEQLKLVDLQSIPPRIVRLIG